MELYKKIMASTILCGTVIIGLAKTLSNIGEEVYRGKIDEYSVVYEEGRISSEHDSRFMKNIMTLKKGNIYYVFEDIKDETDIDWKNEIKPNLEKNKLEKIILKIGDKSEIYYRPDINNPSNPYYTIEDKNNEEIFHESDSLYNSLREKIREELRNKYKQEQKIFRDAVEK